LTAVTGLVPADPAGAASAGSRRCAAAVVPAADSVAASEVDGEVDGVEPDAGDADVAPPGEPVLGSPIRRRISAWLRNRPTTSNVNIAAAAPSATTSAVMV